MFDNERARLCLAGCADVGRFVLFKKLAGKCQALFKRTQRSGIIAGVQPGASHVLESEHKIPVVLSGRAPSSFVLTLFEVSPQCGGEVRRRIRGSGGNAVILCNEPTPYAQALVVKCDCGGIVIVGLPKIADLPERNAEVALQLFVVLVGVGKAPADSKTFLVDGKCLNWITVTNISCASSSKSANKSP